MINTTYTLIKIISTFYIYDSNDQTFDCKGGEFIAIKQHDGTFCFPYFNGQYVSTCVALASEIKVLEELNLSQNQNQNSQALSLKDFLGQEVKMIEFK